MQPVIELFFFKVLTSLFCVKCFRVENKFCPNKKLLRLTEIYRPIRPLSHVSGFFLKTDIFSSVSAEMRVHT